MAIDLTEAGVHGARISAMSEAAAQLCADEDLEVTLARLSRIARQTVPGCAAAAARCLEAGEHTHTAASGALADSLETLQATAGEGPSAAARAGARLVVSANLAEDRRWPRLAQQVSAQLGACSAVGALLPVQRTRQSTAVEPVGVLGLYAPRHDAFDAEACAIAALLAACAAPIVDAARRLAELHAALERRDMIGQAKGILMVRRGITADQAFAYLREASQRSNVKLREVARRVVDQAPGQPDRQR